MGEAKRKRREGIPLTPADVVKQFEGKPYATMPKLSKNSPGVGRWMKKLNGRRDATIEDLMAAQGEFKERQTWFKSHQIDQLEIPDNLNVFATMEAAWQDLVDRWFHEGMPDRLQQDAKFIFYHGVQAAANLMMYCEGQDMFGAAADQVQGDCIAYEKEAEAVLAERKADEWRTGEI